MDDNEVPDLAREWTLGDRVREICHKASGPLQVLIAGGLATALHYTTDPETMGRLNVYLVRGLGYTAAAGMVVDGVRITMFYLDLYRTIHNNLNSPGQEISE